MSKVNKYSDDEIKYILKLRKNKYTYKEIAEKVNKKFGHNRTKRGIGSLFYRLGKTKSIDEYTTRELEFIKEHVKYYTIAEVTKMLNKKFGKQRTRSGVSSIMNKVGITSGNTGRFKKGQIPLNYKELYSERVDKDGYTLIKVEEPDKWVLKHRLLYEQHYNIKLTKSDIIIFKDGNKNNLNIDNLIKIDNRQHLEMNKLNLRSSHPEITEAGVNLSKLIIDISDKSVTK